MGMGAGENGDAGPGVTTGVAESDRRYVLACGGDHRGKAVDWAGERCAVQSSNSPPIKGGSPGAGGGRVCVSRVASPTAQPCAPPLPARPGLPLGPGDVQR